MNIFTPQVLPQLTTTLINLLPSASRLPARCTSITLPAKTRQSLLSLTIHDVTGVGETSQPLLYWTTFAGQEAFIIILIYHFYPEEAEEA